MESQLHLIVIFTFVIVLVTIIRFFRWKRAQLWHETARLALEKGQPLPLNPATDGGCFGGRNGFGPMGELRRGLVLIAVAGGLYLGLKGDARAWAALPGLIGVAFLVFALFSWMRPTPPAPPRDPASKL